MTSQLNSRLLSFYRSASRSAGGIVFVVGFLVLAGWLLNIPAFKSILPGMTTMKANTALAFVLAGISMRFASSEHKNQHLDLIAKACATLMALIGLLTISEYIFNWDLGIDQLLFKDTLTDTSAYPGRMSPVTALNISLLGFSLLLLVHHQYRRLIEVFSITALLISVLVLIGYAYGVPSLYHFSPYSSIALHTALAFSILCLGILFAHPERGLMRVFSSDNLGGLMARRLTPAALVFPFLLGGLFLTGERMGLYDSTMRLVLFSMSTVIIFAILILWNANLLQRADMMRQQTQTQLSRSEERKATILDTSLDAIITIDHSGRVLEFNPAAQKIFGYTEAEVLGKEMSQLIIPASLREQHRTGLANFLATGEGPVLGKRIEMKGMRADGTEFPVELTITVDAGGELPVFTGFVRDITQRKQAEKTLRESEERFRLVVHAAPSAMIAADREGKINMANVRAQELFGYPEEELLGRPIEMLVPERFRSGHGNYRRRFLARPASRPMGAERDLFGLHKDGREIPIEIGLTPYESSEGPFTLALIVDITERSRAQEKIAYQSYLLENVNDAVIGSDENSIIRFWNQGAERIFGWKAEEVLGRSGREILRSQLTNTDRETVLRILAEQGRWRGESILYRKDGSQVIMEVSSITLRDTNGMITGYVSVNRDITERKQAEAVLQESEEKYRTLFESIDQGFCTIEVLFDKDEKPVDYRFLIVNPAFERQTGIPNAVGRRMREIAPLHEEHWFRIYGEIALTGEPMRFENPATQLQRYYEVYAWKVGMPEERKVAILFNDITERKRAEEKIRKLNEELEQRVVERTAALSQANSLLQIMLDNMPDQIYFKDAQSRFIRNSRSQARALGLRDPAEAIGKSDFDFFPHAQLSYEKEQEIIRSGQPLVDEEERVVWPDGRETWVLTNKVPLLDQAGQIIGTFGISRDITERKRAEAAVQKAKLELEAANKELEAFSYSVSHDLRSPLRSIDGFSQALLEDYADQLPPEGQNYLKRVRSAAQRMAELIDDLLNLSKVTRAPMKLVPVDLSQLAERIAAELQRTQPERQVNFNITPNMKARGDLSLIQAALENLLNNAWKYSSKRDRAQIDFGSKYENGETVYFVRDNGAGFDMTYAGKLFGAFQRLHAMTEFPGTGIGLATVQRIIHRHGGHISAEGAVDQGATFFFTLPALERAKPEPLTQEKDSLTKRVREII